MEYSYENFLEKFLSVTDKKEYAENAARFLDEWLKGEEFKSYKGQIEHLISNGKWGYLLDCFYRVMPFGTGGRRGPVGVGPNRINRYTIMQSAQGHSQYLKKKYAGSKKEFKIVMVYDMRVSQIDPSLDYDIENPILDLSGRELSEAAARVYVANGFKVFVYPDFRSTPQLSFTVRELGALSGIVFSASHNPAEDNGKKIYDAHGGQLIPPFDEELVEEVSSNVQEIKMVEVESSEFKEGVVELGDAWDQKYIDAVKDVAMVREDDNKDKLNILYSPLHGTGITSLYPVLKGLGYVVDLEPKTKDADSKFSNVTYGIANPEVPETFDIALDYAKSNNHKYDIILATDPDADRVAVVERRGEDQYYFFTGNEIAVILSEYVIEKWRVLGREVGKGVIVKTLVTTNQIARQAEVNGVRCVGDLLVGFKYIGNEMNKLESEGQIENFMVGLEESLGYLTGGYARDKDAASASVWIVELATKLKTKGSSLFEYLEGIHKKYGLYKNSLSEIRLPGISGMEQIGKIMADIRKNPPSTLGDFCVGEQTDKLEGVAADASNTEKTSSNVIILKLEGGDGVSHMQVTIRPSGTEPKIKFYFEVGSDVPDIQKAHVLLDDKLEQIEKSIFLYVYKILGVEFPERGFKLFFQMPLNDKLKYFEVEEEIVKLVDVKDRSDRRKRVLSLLSFVGSDPIKKVNSAFRDKFEKGIEEYLDI